MTLSVNPQLLTKSPVTFSGNASKQSQVALPSFAGDSVTFSGSRVQVSSAEDFHQVLGSFDNPEAYNEKYDTDLARERSAADVKTDGDKAAALVEFLVSDVGQQVPVTVKPFNEEFGLGYKEMVIDGTDASIVLSYAGQNVDKTRPSKIPMIHIHNKATNSLYPVYTTQKQITDDYTTSGSHGCVSQQARDTAAKFESLVK